MDIFPIFAIGLGIQKSPEGLPFARKMFTENKKMLKSVSNVPGHLTTLSGYKRNTIIVTHKDTTNLRNIKRLIYTHALNFFAGCGYDTTKYDLEVVNIWLNEMRNICEHKAHNHYGYQISGCFYVDMPKNTGDILFINNDKNVAYGMVDSKTYTVYNSMTWRMTPEEGDMYFWRSDVLHQVLSSEFSGVRRSIAFDINVLDKVD
jgi:uncharacterized protein (TIGR02466 family)